MPRERVRWLAGATFFQNTGTGTGSAATTSTERLEGLPVLLLEGCRSDDLVKPVGGRGSPVFVIGNLPAGEGPSTSVGGLDGRSSDVDV